MRRTAGWFNLLLTLCLISLSTPAFASPAEGSKSADAPSTQSTSTPTETPKSGKKPKKPKPIESIRIYVESKHDIQERSLQATVGRSSPMKFTVEKLPILNEVHVVGASLLDQPGSYQVEIKFDSIGSRILESYTSAAAGRHLVVMTEIEKEGRWIAAPLIRRRIGDGRLTFTPDASRDDMDRLVKGLNQLIEKKRKRLLN